MNKNYNCCFLTSEEKNKSFEKQILVGQSTLISRLSRLFRVFPSTGIICKLSSGSSHTRDGPQQHKLEDRRPEENRTNQKGWYYYKV